MNRGHRDLILLAVSVTLTLTSIEVALRVAPERWFGHRASLWRLAMYEGFYFYCAPKPPEHPPKSFHPFRGWTDFTIRSDRERYVIEDVPGSAWRPPQTLPRTKTKKRVVLIGDSFVYGWQVSKDETIDSFLRAYLGDEFEVANLGVRAYAIDQMALLAVEVVPQLSPDIVVLAFIAGDLSRSCVSFSALAGGAAKPKFEIREGRLAMSSIELPTPYQNYLRHQSLKQRILNLVAARLYSCRVLGLAMEPFLRPSWDKCVSDLNARLLGDLTSRLRPSTRLIYWHLDGTLPNRFVQETRKLDVGYFSAATRLEEIARKLSVSPDRHEDGHPKGPLNKIYAFMIYESIMGLSMK